MCICLHSNNIQVVSENRCRHKNHIAMQTRNLSSLRIQACNKISVTAVVFKGTIKMLLLCDFIYIFTYIHTHICTFISDTIPSNLKCTIFKARKLIIKRGKMEEEEYVLE